MSALGIWNLRYEGGTCYAACMETFTFYNPSIAICWKGCDYATGRVKDDKGRDQARKMCKRFTSESMATQVGELQRATDLQVHSQLFPTVPQNIYRACLAGIRRQRYCLSTLNIISQQSSDQNFVLPTIIERCLIEQYNLNDRNVLKSQSSLNSH